MNEIIVGLILVLLTIGQAEKPDFLVDKVDEYPAFIERRQAELEIESHACRARTAHLAMGGTEWRDVSDTDPSCQNKRKTERWIQRAKDEFKARLCTGR